MRARAKSLLSANAAATNANPQSAREHATGNVGIEFTAALKNGTATATAAAWEALAKKTSGSSGHRSGLNATANAGQ